MMSVTQRSIKPGMARAAERMADLLGRIERIPWYWIAAFTSIALLMISILVDRTVPNSRLAYFAGEYGAVGAALAQGRGFSDPFAVGTGATAWVSPLLAALIGLVFYLTDLDLSASYWILHCIKMAALGLGAGWIWAALQDSGRGIASVCYVWIVILLTIHNNQLIYLFHDEWLIFLEISLAFWALQRQAKANGQMILLVAFSAAALSHPILWGALCISLLVFQRAVPADDSVSPAGASGERRRPLVRNPVWIAVAVSFLLIAGWTLRNGIQLGMFAPIKANAGYEIYQAQFASKNGVLDYTTFAGHPYNPLSAENQAYRTLGETRFLAERRAAALGSILADPLDFGRRVAYRFSNAFLFTASPANIARVDPRISADDLERLRKAGFVEYYFDRKIWIELDDPDKDLAKVLPSLGLADPQLVEDNWRTMTAGNYWVRFSWERVVEGCLLGGLPWIALLIAIILRRRSAIPPPIRWAGLFLFLYLLPYTLISHYIRYQIPLLGVQAILLTAGTVALLRTLRQAGWSAIKHKAIVSLAIFV
jgi:hypothetical protein